MPLLCRRRSSGSFLPFFVFLQALIQGGALVVNAFAEAQAVLGAGIIAASVRALEFGITGPDVVHKSIDDDHCGDDCDNTSEKYPWKLAGHLLLWRFTDVAR